MKLEWFFFYQIYVLWGVHSRFFFFSRKFDLLILVHWSPHYTIIPCLAQLKLTLWHNKYLLYFSHIHVFFLHSHPRCRCSHLRENSRHLVTSIASGELSWCHRPPWKVTRAPEQSRKQVDGQVGRFPGNPAITGHGLCLEEKGFGELSHFQSSLWAWIESTSTEWRIYGKIDADKSQLFVSEICKCNLCVQTKCHMKVYASCN